MTSISRILLSACLLGIVGATTSLAQDDDEQLKTPERRRAQVDPAIALREVMSIGAHVGLGFVNHAATFSGLPGVPTCCPEFDGGSGTGIVAGLEAMLPIADDWRLMARVSFQGLGGTFETMEPTTIRMGNQAVETAFRHTFDATLSMLAIEPALEWRIAGGLGVVAGGRVGFVSGGTYKQTEELGDPSIPYVFLNGRAVFAERNGNLEDIASMQIGLLVALRYHLNVGGNVSIAPEVAYAPNFSDLRNDFAWKASSLRIGATMMLTIRGRDVMATPLTPR